MANSTPTPTLLTDPGFLFWAPLGSAEPTNTVAGSVFTDAWPVAWVNLGATEEGGTFTYDVSVDATRVAELLDPIRYATTERSGAMAFALASATLTNLKKVLNGGTLTVVSGTGATTLTSYTPPTPGAEVRSMIGWESLDATARLICYQCFAGGTLELAFRKAPDFVKLPATFNLEIPSSGVPWKAYSAGVARG
jgi:hypothetical protein